MTDNVAPLVSECKRIENFSLWNSASHFGAATYAGYLHWALSTVPVILGAVGSWKFLPDPSAASPRQLLTAGICTLLAGISGSLLSVWNLNKVRAEHFAAA